MQENGFPHSAFVFETESLSDSTNITGTQIPPGALITLLQKSLIYLKLEKAIRTAKADPTFTASNEIEKITNHFKENVVAHSDREEKEVQKLTNDNCTFLSTLSTSIQALKWSKNGKMLAAYSPDGTASLWMRDDNDQTTCVNLGTQAQSSNPRCSNSIAWNCSDELLAIAYDKQVKLYSITGDEIVTIDEPVSVLAFNPSQTGTLATCNSEDFSTTIWDIHNGEVKQLEKFSMQAGLILDIAWRDEGAFATASSDETVAFHSVNGSQSTVVKHGSPVTCVSWSIDGSMLASGCDDGSIHIWRESKLFRDITGHNGGITKFEWLPNSNQIFVSASLDGTIRVHDALSGETHVTFGNHRGGTTSLSFSPNGKYLVTGGKDGLVSIWKFDDFCQIASLSYNNVVLGLQFNPVSDDIAVCFEDPNILVIPLKNFVS